MGSKYLQVGAWLGFLGVVIGAFGRHALESKITAQNLDIFEIGARYHQIHSVALIAVAILGLQRPSKYFDRSCICFAAGIIVFSASLYALAITNIKVLGAITPIGGLLFMMGWIFLAIGAGKLSPEKLGSGSHPT